MSITVIIPTYNPLPSRIQKTIDSLKRQTIEYKYWDLLVIDNNSSFRIEDTIDLSWHPNSKVIVEPRQGLTFARLKGFQKATRDIVILVDDDNLLEKEYLQKALAIFKNYPNLGTIGGKSMPLFESPPPDWLYEFNSSLALRDLGERVIIEKWADKYPEAAPIGAGMAIRKIALRSYIKKVSCGKNVITDRKGDSLSSGGDNDIVIEILKSGWESGYFPSLVLHHIIPMERMQVNYLARLINNTNKSWIQLLESHGVNLWPRVPAWTVPLRKLKAWFVYKAWVNKVNYIKWRGACGLFDGLSNNNYLS